MWGGHPSPIQQVWGRRSSLIQQVWGRHSCPPMAISQLHLLEATKSQPRRRRCTPAPPAIFTVPSPSPPASKPEESGRSGLNRRPGSDVEERPFRAASELTFETG